MGMVLLEEYIWHKDWRRINAKIGSIFSRFIRLFTGHLPRPNNKNKNNLSLRMNDRINTVDSH